MRYITMKWKWHRQYTADDCYYKSDIYNLVVCAKVSLASVISFDTQMVTIFRHTLKAILVWPWFGLVLYLSYGSVIMPKSYFIFVLCWHCLFEETSQLKGWCCWCDRVGLPYITAHTMMVFMWQSWSSLHYS